MNGKLAAAGTSMADIGPKDPPNSMNEKNTFRTGETW